MSKIDIDKFVCSLRRRFGENKGIATRLDSCLRDQGLKFIDTPDGGRLENQGEQKFEQKFFINDKVVHKATGKIWTIHHYLKDTNSYYVENNDGLLHHYRESELKLVEQKPAEWSEEDVKLLDEMYKFFDTHKIPSLKHDMNDYAKFIKSIKDRVQPQPQQEWSEEDERNIKELLYLVEANYLSSEEPHDRLIKFLKSLRPQSQWKPSDGQMSTLWDAIVYVEGCNSNFKGSGSVLENLYNNLKKLMEE